MLLLYCDKLALLKRTLSSGAAFRGVGAAIASGAIAYEIGPVINKVFAAQSETPMYNGSYATGFVLSGVLATMAVDSIARPVLTYCKESSYSRYIRKNVPELAQNAQLDLNLISVMYLDAIVAKGASKGFSRKRVYTLLGAVYESAEPCNLLEDMIPKMPSEIQKNLIRKTRVLASERLEVLENCEETIKRNKDKPMKFTSDGNSIRAILRGVEFNGELYITKLEDPTTHAIGSLPQDIRDPQRRHLDPISIQLNPNTGRYEPSRRYVQPIIDARDDFGDKDKLLDFQFFRNPLIGAALGGVAAIMDINHGNNIGLTGLAIGVFGGGAIGFMPQLLDPYSRLHNSIEEWMYDKENRLPLYHRPIGWWAYRLGGLVYADSYVHHQIRHWFMTERHWYLFLPLWPFRVGYETAWLLALKAPQDSIKVIGGFIVDKFFKEKVKQLYKIWKFSAGLALTYETVAHVIEPGLQSIGLSDKSRDVLEVGIGAAAYYLVPKTVDVLRKALKK